MGKQQNSQSQDTNPIIDKLLKLAQENPNKVSEQAISLKDTKDYSELGTGSGSSKAVPKYYEKIGNKLGWSPFSLPQDMEKEAYTNQGGLEVMSNTIKGFGVQALAGVVDSVAAWDMKGLYDVSVGNTEQQYGNWLNELGKDLREHSNENYQIYQDGDSMWNSSYWAKQGQSLGYTGGIIAETIGEQIALGYLTGGAGNEAALASKSRLLGQVGQGAFGMWKGVQEGYMNALETQSNVYQKYTELGYQEEEARKKANEAATLGFRAEVGPLAAINALQFMTTFGIAKGAFSRTSGANLGFSGGVETLVDKALPGITNKYGKAAVGFGVNALSEGVEEGIQTGVSKYAQHEILKSTGNEEGDLDLWDKEMRDSIIGGVLGGGLFAGAGKLLQPYTMGTAAKAYSRQHDDFLKQAVSRTANTFDNQQKIAEIYNQAEQTYSQNKSKDNFAKLEQAKKAVKEAQYNSHLTNTVNALQLDYINGKTTAFESHVEQMQNLLDAVEKGDLDTLKKYNVIGEDNKEKFEGSLDTIKNTFKQNIKDSQEIKDKLENNLLNVTSDFESAYNITKKEYINTKGLDNIEEYSQALGTLYTKDRQFNQLSSDGQRRFKLETELESFNRLDKLSENNKERKIEIEEDLKNVNNYNTNDKLVVDSIAKTPYVSAHTSINSIKQSIEDTNKDLAVLRDEKTITEKVKERKKRSLLNSKSREEVEDTLAQAQQEGVITPEMEAIAEVKKSELAAQETIQTVNPDYKELDNTVKPKEGSKTELTESEQAEKLAQMLSSGRLSSVDEQAFSPRELQGKLSDEQTIKLKDSTDIYANMLAKELGREPNFTDLIKDRIERTSYDNAESTFNAYKKMWAVSGRDISDAQNVYDSYFNAFQKFEDLAQAILSTEDVILDTNVIVQEAIVSNSKTISYDKDNRPVEKDGNYSQSFQTASFKTKAAFLGVQYTDVKNEDGTISRMPVIAQLNKSEQIDNNFVLDYDMIKPGVTLEVRIPQDYMNFKVADWTFTDNKWVKSEIKFSDWVNKYNVEPGSIKFNNKLPMVANLNDKDIFYIHDTDWYNTSNIALVEEQKEIEKKGKLEVQALRQNVLAGNTKITIEERKFGSIFKLNSLNTNNDPISISEATGNTKIVLAKTFDELIDSNGSVTSKIKLVNNLEKHKFQVGQIYELREVNTNEFIAMPVLTNDAHKQEPINDTAYNNVKHSIIASVLLNGQNVPTLVSGLESKYGMTLSKAREIQNQLQASTKYDIQYEIGDYLSMFVNVDSKSNNMVSKLENTAINSDTGKAKFPNNTNYVAVDNNVIKIAYKDGSSIPRNDKGFDTLQGINLGNITEKSVPIILSLLDKNFTGSEGQFKNTHFDISKGQLNKNRPFVKVSENGSIVPYTNKHGENTYEGYIKDSVKTNVKSFEIKDKDGSSKWVTDVQPMIYFGLVKEEKTTVEIDNKEILKKELKEKLAELPKDSLYTVHLAQDRDVQSILNTGFNYNGTLEGTTYTFTSTENIYNTLSKIIDEGKSEHRETSSMIIMTFPKSILGDSKLNQAADLIQNYLIEQDGSEASLVVPSKYITAYFTNNELQIRDNSFVEIKENVNIQEALSFIPEDLKVETLRILKGLDLDEDDINFNFSRFEFTPEQNEEIDAIQNNSISSLSPIQQKVLTSSLFNLILEDIDTNAGTVNLANIVSKIDSSIDTFIQPQIDAIKENRDNLIKLNNPGMQTIIDKFNDKIVQLDTIVFEKQKIISNGIKTPKGDLYKKFERFLAEELVGSEDVITNDNGEVEYNFNMSALEKDIKLSFSNNLKIFFAGINKQKAKTREDITNFAYLKDFIEVDDVIQSLTEVMVGLPSSIEDLISVLETKKEQPVYNQILNKIKNASEEIQNEILYKMIQSKLDMQMVLYSYNRENNTYSLKIINPNSSSSDIKLKQQWQTNFRNSDLFKTVGEQRVYNKEAVNGLINRIQDLKELNVENVKDILNTLGIEVNNNTIAKHIEQEGTNILLEKTGILGVFKTNLKSILDNNKNTELITLEDTTNNPYENAKGVVDILINTEIELNGTRVAKSFRVGSKSIQGAIQKMMVYDIKEQLKDLESPLFRALSEIPYSRRNYVLNLLQQNEKFRENFEVSFVSLEAIKQNRQKIYDDRKINKLATTDNMLTQYAFFQNTLKELGEVVPNTDLKFRMGHMFNPSLSDKEQMVLYSTALVDLDYKNFNIIEDKITLSPEVISFVTDQIYTAEFDRIVNTYNNPTNIKNYDGAAKRFLSIPELNNMVSSQGANIHDVIAKAHGDIKTINAIREQFKENANVVIGRTIEADVLSKVDILNRKGSWFKNAFLSLDDKDNVEVSFFDSKYLKSKKGKNDKLSTEKLVQIVAYDFVTNQYLHQNNVYQLVAGDMALYAPSVKKYTNKETKQIDNVAFSKAIGESISKRMAMLIAPGNKLANSKDDKYIQVFVNDPIKITSTAREFIKQYYGSVSENNETLLNKLDEVENKIQELYSARKTEANFEDSLNTLNDSRDKILKILEETNSEIGGYFNIEGTDAQEYTTWKEHIDILVRQGRLSTEEKVIVTSAYGKLLKGEDLDTKELSLVMNPLKPVYSGNNILNDIEGKASVNRIIYIKSSSFPLLPQMTKDFKLDKIRQHMESLESTTGKNVRLSYQTANKVGAISTKLTVDDLYNVPFEELYNGGNGKLSQASLVLDRNNFKIQQDTPYKTAKFLKKNSDDMTTMGSQMWKIILGNGINKIETKVFPNLFGQDLIDSVNNKLLLEGYEIKSNNGMISGRDLDKLKFHIESMYFDIQKELLYDELGLDRDSRKPINTNETVKLLHALLEREVTTRQYPEGIIDNLELTYTKNELEFMLPIWLSNGSNKFESLMQAIITNRLIQINLPGNQHISSSSEGFVKVTSLEELNRGIKSKVIWVNPNHTGELKATVVDGVLKESEVLLQSKFRITNIEKGKRKTKLIDLTKAPYSSVQNGVLVLNMDMIDEELLSNFSFRIPTSSHQSGAILKVVGFLPEASGDMLVVPKEHTQQLGEDFDIDKRTVYKSNYEIKEDGKISKLNYTESNSSYDKLMQTIFEGEYLPHLSTEEGKSKYASLQGRVKMLENGMVDIYKSVYQSPSIDIQKKINKILSFDNATQTANLINNRLNSSIDDTNFTIYSDDYQRDQMKLGADGKTGIGGHSNAVTFQAQMERLENKLQILEEVTDEKGKLIGHTPRLVTIGKYVSNGILGNIASLDGERNIGDIHTENQNSSTDNIKAQIMGKRNENPYTMNVLIQLTFRGFDMDTFTSRDTKSPAKVQLPSLFISQPILRKYVELKEQNKSITSDFDANAEQTILNKLIVEFGGDVKVVRDEFGNIDKTNFLEDILYSISSGRMTGDVLYDNLINQEDLKTWDSTIQLSVLQKFFKLEEEAKHLGKYQSLINLSTSGLGISYFNVLDRIQSINDMGAEEDIDNLKDLVGKFITKEDFLENPPTDKNNYTLIGDYYIKPTTTEGTVLIQSVSSAEDIMDISYPYKQDYITDYINSIIENKGKDLGKKQKMDLQYKVIGSIRDYLYSTENTGLFNGDINNERLRLFFDKDGNESLASYLKKLKDSKRYSLMYTNELLKAFNYDGIETTGAPSIIKHQTDFNTNFDKTDKYNSFLELIEDNITNLGEFNGEPMTPRKLAQDLASYAYLANNENGAIGFKDFINVKYLTIAGVSESIRSIDKNRDGWNMNALMTNFVKQFYQHNPDEARILSPNNTSIDTFEMLDEDSNKTRNKIKAVIDKDKAGLMTGLLRNLKEFTLKEPGPEYLAIRNTDIKLSDNQYNLYKFNGTKYVKIPVLGTFGYNEYNPTNINQKSIIYPEVGIDFLEQVGKPIIVNNSGVDLNQVLDLSNGVVSLMEQIYNSSNNQYKEFAEQLIPYLDSTTKIKIESITTSKGELSTAVYLKNENTIYINPNLVNELLDKKGIAYSNVNNVIEEIVLEELIHSLTISQLDRFGTMNNDVFTLNDNAPVFMSKLVGLYEIAKSKLPEEYYTKNLYEFTAGVFVSEEFKQILDNTIHNGKSLLDMFKDTIASMVRYITGSTYSDETRNTIFELLGVAKVNTRVTSNTSNIIEQMKKEDLKIDLELNKIEAPRINLENNLKTVSEFNTQLADKVIDRFDNGEIFTITPSSLRSKESNEYKYVDAIITHISNMNLVKITSDNINDYIVITNINNTTQIIQKKKSLSDIMFTSVPEDFSSREFRLPEIKKC